MGKLFLRKVKFYVKNGSGAGWYFFIQSCNPVRSPVPHVPLLLLHPP
jgi:hypothetical protein